MPSVLFVCTANRFRSPLSAAWFRRRLERDSFLQDWSVGSAGTWAEAGLTIFPSPEWINERIGLDLSDHRSQPVTRELIDQYDLILTMEKNHCEALSVEFPEKSGHLFLLSKVTVGLKYDVLDPGNQKSENAIIEIADDLHDLINKGYENICYLARLLHSVN
jgi:protein-tyrosine phosphatase